MLALIVEGEVQVTCVVCYALQQEQVPSIYTVNTLAKLLCKPSAVNFDCANRSDTGCLHLCAVLVSRYMHQFANKLVQLLNTV